MYNVIIVLKSFDVIFSDYLYFYLFYIFILFDVNKIDGLGRFPLGSNTHFIFPFLSFRNVRNIKYRSEKPFLD